MLPFYSDDAVTIWHGNALDLPLEDESVDLICTSPPYFGLRAYSDGGETYGGQIGSEATPGEFLDALAAATREMARVLKPSGSIFVNLGDKYQATSFAPQKRGKDASGVERPTETKACERCGEDFTGGLGRRFCSSYCGGSDNSPRAQRGGIPVKSLMLLPERYRIRCVDDLGLIARAVIVWAKPNGLPESVRDRVRRSHEDWVHLTKEPRYFTGIDEIREPYAPGMADRAARYAGREIEPNTWSADSGRGDSNPSRGNLGFSHRGLQPLGKLPGSVWTIPTQPLRVPPELGIQHFAAFPFEFPRRIIRGWSPSGICVECGEGRRPVRESEGETPRQMLKRLGGTDRHENAGKQGLDFQGSHTIWRTHRITGYACACDAPTAPTRPAVILDPFGGTGTTAVVAKALGRQAHLVDLSRDYCRLAQWRVNDSKELAKAGQVKAAKKAKVTKMRRAAEPEQGSLLDDPAA